MLTKSTAFRMSQKKKDNIETKNLKHKLESTPSIVPSSVIGSMGSLVSTPVTPSALSEFSAAVSVESSTSASLKKTETSYIVAASDRRLDAAVAMHAPSELESPALVQ